MKKDRIDLYLEDPSAFKQFQLRSIAERNYRRLNRPWRRFWRWVAR